MTQEEAKYILEHTVLSWSVNGSDAREAIQIAIKELKRKKGKWIEDEEGCLTCSLCGNPSEINILSGEFMETNYCSECGADMRGEQE